MAAAAHERSYLGIPLLKPRAAVFDFTSCEGCQLQLINREETLLQFLSLMHIVNFREAMTERSDEYEIAFIEGSISRADEEDRLKAIRKKAKILVALGSCACFGGVNGIRNRFAPEEAVRRVYGDAAVQTNEVKPIEAVVEVDLRIYGCPVRKEEVERIVTDLALGKMLRMPKYPVCFECKADEHVCLFDLGEPCLGPITRAGCGAWCPSNRAACWGCRGPAEDMNLAEMEMIMARRGVPPETVLDRLETFGGFARFVRNGVMSKSEAETEK